MEYGVGGGGVFLLPAAESVENLRMVEMKVTYCMQRI